MSVGDRVMVKNIGPEWDGRIGVIIPEPDGAIKIRGELIWVDVTGKGIFGFDLNCLQEML